MEEMQINMENEVKNVRYEDKYGDVHWYKDDLLHCEEGPAFETLNGTKKWYVNGQKHRVDGPAIEWANGSKEWYFEGKRHREDGPAVEWSKGKEWWVNGVEFTEEEFRKYQLNKKLNQTLEEKPQGKKVKI